VAFGDRERRHRDLTGTLAADWDAVA
jgi:hypothetical protein